MKRYDPERAPDPEKWLALDEQERIMLVEAYHRRARVKLPDRTLHAAIHAVIESQLAARLPVVQATLERLLAQGLDRHDAIHAIGSVVAEYMWKAMNKKRRDPNPESYFRRLEALNASDWLEGAR